MTNQNFQFRANVHFEDCQIVPGIILLNTSNGSVYLNFYTRNLEDKNDKIKRGSSPDQVRDLSEYFCYKVVMTNSEIWVIFSDFSAESQKLLNKDEVDLAALKKRKAFMIQFLSIENNINFYQFPEIILSSLQNLSDFITYLKQKFQIVSCHIPYCYLLNPLDDTPSKVYSTFLQKDSTEEYDLSVLYEVFQSSIQGIDISEIQSLSVSNSFTMLTEKFKNPKYDIKDDIYFKIKDNWKKMYEFGPILENQTKFQEIVAKVDKNISKITELKGPNSEKLCEIMRNVIITYVIYNFDGSDFLCDNVRFLYVILDAYVTEFSKDFKGQSKKKIKSEEEEEEEENDKIDKQELCEMKIFQTLHYIYCYGSFHEFNSPQMQRSFSSTNLYISYYLRKLFPGTNLYLIKKGIISLDFMIEYASKWFIVISEIKCLQKIWCEIPQYDDMFHFFKCFLLALLLLFDDELKMIYKPNKEIMFMRFEKFLMELSEDKVNNLLILTRCLKGQININNKFPVKYFFGFAFLLNL